MLARNLWTYFATDIDGLVRISSACIKVQDIRHPGPRQLNIMAPQAWARRGNRMVSLKVSSLGVVPLTSYLWVVTVATSDDGRESHTVDVSEVSDPSLSHKGENQNWFSSRTM
jgi:hypothetical protein